MVILTQLKQNFLNREIKLQKERRVLVTGVNGFICGAMFDHLSEKADDGYRVVGYDLRKEDNFEPNIEYVKQIIEANDINVVMHFGAISSTAEKDIDKVLRFNYDFTKDLVDFCYEKDILLQFSSSASVYGNKNATFKESDIPNPQSPYAISKYLCERYIMDKIMNDGAMIQAFRYFNVYSFSLGKMLEEHKGNQASPYSKFYISLLNDQKIKLFYGSENYKRDFIYYERVIDTHLKFIDIEEDGIWNLGTGKTKSFKGVAEFICLGTNLDDRIEYIPMPDEIKDQYQEYTCADMTKMNETLKRHGK